MFYVRYKASEDAEYEVLQLRPHPTDVDYPTKRLFTRHTTQDNNNVIQRPLRDPRPRRWIWKGYPPRFPVFYNQWLKLKDLEHRARVENALWPIVEIWEDESTRGGFDRVDENGEKVWTKVRFIEVDETIRQGGGLVTYDEAWVEFVVEDPDYRWF